MAGPAISAHEEPLPENVLLLRNHSRSAKQQAIQVRYVYGKLSVSDRGEENQAIALYVAGHSTRDMVARMKGECHNMITPPTVARWIKADGKSRPVGNPRSVELPKEAKRLYKYLVEW